MWSFLSLGNLRNGDSNRENIAADVFEKSSQVPRHPLGL